MDKVIGRGRTAEIIAWEDDRVLKLFYADRSYESIQYEYKVSQVVFTSDVASPRPYEMIELEGRHGIVYERVYGDSMLSVLGSRPWTLFAQASLLAELHAAMHGHETNRLPSQRNLLERQLREVARFFPDIAQAALKVLDQLPDDNKVCHGDLHPDNVILSPRGAVIIDWMNAVMGNPYADVARTLLLGRKAAIPSEMPMRHVILWLRSMFTDFYLWRYLQMCPQARAQIEAWALPIAVARLTEGIMEERQGLLNWIEKYLERHVV